MYFYTIRMEARPLLQLSDSSPSKQKLYRLVTEALRLNCPTWSNLSPKLRLGASWYWKSAFKVVSPITFSYTRLHQGKFLKWTHHLGYCYQVLTRSKRIFSHGLFNYPLMGLRASKHIYINWINSVVTDTFCCSSHHAWCVETSLHANTKLGHTHPLTEDTYKK